MSERRRRKKEEDEEDGGRCAQSTRAAGCYNNSTLVAPSLSLFSASLSFSDHPLIVCSPLSFGALCLSIKPPIYPPPSTPLSLLHPFSSSFSSSSSSCSGSSSAQRRKTICLTNKSLLPPRERACLSLSPLSLLAFVVLPLSVVGAGRGAVSRCLCQRIHGETQEAKQAALSSFFFPLLSLVFYIFFYFLNSNALFFPLALANHSSLIKLLQKSLSMSLDVISLLAAWILSLTHANAPPFLSIPSASKVFHCCDCQKETLLGSV